MNARYKKQRQQRMKELWAFDLAMLAQARVTALIGVDEVGRGSLIGPVVAGAVLLPARFDQIVRYEHMLLELDDSKAPHLHHQKRLALANLLKNLCIWGIGEACKEEIETLNIYHASLLASHRAVMDLISRHENPVEAQTYLVSIDGRVKIPHLPNPQRSEVKGDGKSAAIAAASIIAKAHRDEWVIACSKTYPGYGWETNMGYATPAHKKALENLGVTPLHRQTYSAVQETLAFK